MFLRSFLAAAAVGGALYASPAESAPALRQSAFVSAPLAGMRKSGSFVKSAGRASVPVGPKMQGTDAPAINSASSTRDEAMARSKNNQYEWEWGTRQAWTTEWSEVKEQFVKAFGVSADSFDDVR
jgi:hypothetical protein